MTIDQFFELFKNSENVSYTQKESKVFNLQGVNMPLKTHHLIFNYHGGILKLYYEDLYNPPPGLAAYGGRQLCYLSCSFPTGEKLDNFNIEKRGLWARIMKPATDKNFLVKTKDKNLLIGLLSDEHLVSIYKRAEQTSLSPSISGKSFPTNASRYEISLSFGATVFESNVLFPAIDFCKKMIDLKGSR